MINIFLIDEIDRVRRNFDEDGVPTNSTNPGINARVEDYNRMVRGVNGEEVQGSMLIITDQDEDITYEDMIVIKKKNGTAYYLPTKEWAILKIDNIAGFMASHKEIYI